MSKKIVVFVVGVLLVVCVSSCAGAMRAAVERDAAMSTGCDNARVVKMSMDVARVSACGKPYTCYRKGSSDRTGQVFGLDDAHWECRRAR